MTRYLQQ